MLNEREQKLLGRLPPASRLKIAKLNSEIDAAHAANRAGSERRGEIREAIQTDEANLAQMLASPHAAEDNQRIAMAREAIALRRQELLDIDAATNERVEKNQACHSIVRRTLELLTSLPADMMPALDKTAPATVRKGETIGAAVERCRVRVADLRSELAAVEAAPIPAALAKERAKNKIEGLAEAGRPGVTNIIEGGADIEWPEAVSRVLGGEVAGYTDGHDAVSLMCFLFKDAVVAAVCREIENEADDANALSPDDRAAALKRIAAEIEDSERMECNFIDQAAAAGVSIAHRSDIGVRAFLGIDKFTKAAPKPDQGPRMTDSAPKRPYSEAPAHSNSLPEPVARQRDPIWQ